MFLPQFSSAEAGFFVGEGYFPSIRCYISGSGEWSCKFGFVCAQPFFSCHGGYSVTCIGRAFTMISRFLGLIPIYFSMLYVNFVMCFHLKQGWRLVSPHFPDLIDSAIFPALVMNEKVKPF